MVSRLLNNHEENDKKITKNLKNTDSFNKTDFYSDILGIKKH